MNIAIIEDDEAYHKLLTEYIKFENQPNWNIDFFTSAKEFGKADLSKYCVIISDHFLPGVSGKNLLKAIRNKTAAHLALMSSSPSIDFDEEDVFDDRMSGLLGKKKDPQNVIEWLKYAYTKCKLSRIAKENKEQFSTMTSITTGMVNGYQLDIKDKTMILGLSNPLSVKSKNELLKELEKNNHRVVVYYTDKIKTFISMYLGQLAFLIDNVKKNNGRLAFVKSKNNLVMKQLRTSNLDKMVNIFDDVNNAIDYVKKS